MRVREDTEQQTVSIAKTRITINQTNPMKRCFTRFGSGINCMSSTEADCERLFSQAKRCLGSQGQHSSLQTIFCRLA
ncbi:MAG: hypothetical protein EZS28_051927 [Streblomastix strix]|uniref:Uncharacterized protein n=1 Tax=Streblomastix strix TaxID=222440 RepID=A0A5J4SU84_9EUKA|nr:MAG: hypothetical protein EZS28_051927 [Streblomastix strix]